MLLLCPIHFETLVSLMKDHSIIFSADKKGLNANNAVQKSKMTNQNENFLMNIKAIPPNRKGGSDAGF